MKSFPFLLIVLLFACSVDAQDSKGTKTCQCQELVIRPEVKTLGADSVVSDFVIVSDDPIFLKHKFEWTASIGEIVEGQGTPRITVKAFKNESNAADFTELVVTAKIADQANCRCKPQWVGVSLVPYSGPVQFFASVHKRRKPEVENQFADVTDLQLSQTELILACESGRKPQEGAKLPTSMVVDVNTTAFDAENDVLTYSYTVSGGRIIGTGAKVKWDLTGVQPGTYTITAGTDDGCGICGKTKMQTVTVAECTPQCGLIECPTIDIAGPSSVKPGEVSSVTADVTGGSQPSVSYEWTVVNGEIVDGQGTPLIKVRGAKNLGNASVVVTLKIGGLDPRAQCADSLTKEFP